MKHMKTQSVNSGITQQQFNLEMQMTVVNDIATDLEIACSWYDDPDLKYGGPPSKELLQFFSKQLRNAYLKMAVLTGQDPCEKLEASEARLEAIRLHREKNDS